MRKKTVDAIDEVIKWTMVGAGLLHLVKRVPTLAIRVRRAHIGHILMAKELAGIGTAKEQAYMQVTDHLLYHWGEYTWPQIEAPKQ